MNIFIRTEEPKDYRQVEEVTRKAFWNLYAPGASEHYLVHTMRSHADYIPELSFVLEEDSEIIGSIHFSYAWVVNSGGEEIPILHLGPVCIIPSRHRQGLGRALITHAIHCSKKLGYRAIVLGGFRYHYELYGFLPSKKYNITMTDGKFYTGIMMLPLYEGALNGITGEIKFSECLYPDESGLEAFDKSFSPMEKQLLPCQKTFENAVSEIDTHDYI